MAYLKDFKQGCLVRFNKEAKKINNNNLSGLVIYSIHSSFGSYVSKNKNRGFEVVWSNGRRENICASYAKYLDILVKESENPKYEIGEMVKILGFSDQGFSRICGLICDSKVVPDRTYCMVNGCGFSTQGEKIIYTLYDSNDEKREVFSWFLERI